MRILNSSREVEIGWKLIGIIDGYEMIEVKTPKGIVVQKLLLTVSRDSNVKDVYLYRFEDDINIHMGKRLILIVVESAVNGLREVVKINHLN